MSKVFSLLVLLAIQTSWIHCAAYAWGSCVSAPVVSNFDAQRYAGKWYEIKRFSSWSEYGSSCVTFNYNYINSTSYTIENIGFNKDDNTTSTIDGTAIIANSSFPNKLFIELPFKVFNYTVYTSQGEYDVWSTDYTTYSVVYSCQQIIPYIMRRDMVWILSRSKQIDPNLLTNLTYFVSLKGIDVSNFESVAQNCTN